MLEYTIYSYNLIILTHRSLDKKPHILSIFSKQTLLAQIFNTSDRVVPKLDLLRLRPMGHGTH